VFGKYKTVQNSQTPWQIDAQNAIVEMQIHKKLLCGNTDLTAKLIQRTRPSPNNIVNIIINDVLFLLHAHKLQTLVYMKFSVKLI